jgi:hypothetical protein
MANLHMIMRRTRETSMGRQTSLSGTDAAFVQCIAYLDV